MLTVGVITVLVVLLIIGVPIGFAMGISGIVGLYAFGGLDSLAGILSTSTVSLATSYELITIPMFLLMAELVLMSGVANDLFHAAAAFVGRVRGGLGMATALAGAGFAAICGSSTASAATLSSTTLPAMLKHNYEPRMAAGVVAISGTLAMLIPPSVALIVYGLVAEVSIGKLLIAGVIPGILVTATIIATIYFLVWQDPARAPSSPTVGWGERLRLLRLTAPMIFLFGAVTGVIYSGIATPTEASALGALGALVVVALRRKLDYRLLVAAVERTIFTSCMILMIILGSTIFGYYIALSQSVQPVLAWVGGLQIPSWIVITVIIIGYLALGCFLDQLAILVLTVPVVLPIVVAQGFDPIWFGIIVIVTAEVGLIHPPVGLNCFVVAKFSGVPVYDVFWGAVPHVIAHMFVIAAFVAFPGIVLWLPSRM